jgi:hypothetical protein
VSGTVTCDMCGITRLEMEAVGTWSTFETADESSEEVFKDFCLSCTAKILDFVLATKEGVTA